MNAADGPGPAAAAGDALETPLVSIIMPNRNYAEFLPQAIESVQAQGLSAWELLVVDDCSTDASREVVTACAARDPRIRLLPLPQNRGPRHARNIGTLKARGRYIAFLDSDDFWMPQKLEAQFAFMRRHGALISTTAYERYHGEDLPRQRVGVPLCIGHRQLLLRNMLNTDTVIYDRTALGRRLNLHPIAQDDYSLWLDILREGHVCYGLDEALAVYRIHKRSYSANKLANLGRRLVAYRTVERMGWLRACWYSFLYALLAVWRRMVQTRPVRAQR